MLRLILDQHISPDVVVTVRRLQPDITVGHVRDRQWQALPDPELLRLAHGDELTLVTYDQASIPDFLRQFAQDQEDHAGVSDFCRYQELSPLRYRRAGPRVGPAVVSRKGRRLA